MNHHSGREGKAFEVIQAQVGLRYCCCCRVGAIVLTNSRFVFEYHRIELRKDYKSIKLHKYEPRMTPAIYDLVGQMRAEDFEFCVPSDMFKAIQLSREGTVSV